MPILSKRMLRGSFFLVCLTLLGIGIYRFEADEPRWTVDDGEAVIDAPIRFSADGERVYASPFPVRSIFTFGFTLGSFDFAKEPPPIKLSTWDLRAGRQRAAHPATGRLTATNEFSKDGRYFAAVCEWQEIPPEGGARFLCLVDLQTDEERRLPLPCSLDEAPLHFSPCGQYLVVGLTEQEGPVQIYECATGQLLEERYCWGLLWNAVFAEGHLLYLDKDDAEQRRIVRWNLRDRKVAATLTTIKDAASVRMIEPFLVVPGAQPGQWFTWNMRTLKVECEWKTVLTDAFLNELMRIGDRWYACIDGWTQSANMLEFWDIQTGKRIASDKHPGRHWGHAHSSHSRYWAVYSPPERLHQIYWSSWQPSPKGFQLFELPSLKKLWELDSTERYAMTFTKGGNRAIVAASTGDAVHIHNCETGKVQQTIVIGQTGAALEAPHVSLSGEGKHLLIQQDVAPVNGWGLVADSPIWRRVLQWLRIDPADPTKARDSTIVYDLESNRELLRLRGWKTDHALLSDDGKTLVTTHTVDGRTRVMRCWDVGSTKPLRWPLAIPMLVGVMVWGMAKGMARWRKGRAAKSA